jgi:hypothetical protein
MNCENAYLTATGGDVKTAGFQKTYRRTTSNHEAISETTALKTSSLFARIVIAGYMDIFHSVRTE